MGKNELLFNIKSNLLDADMLSKYIENGGKLNERDENNCNLLHYALDMDLDPEFFNKEELEKPERSNVIEVLRNFGADFTSKGGKDNLTPTEFMQKHKLEIVKPLRDVARVKQSNSSAEPKLPRKLSGKLPRGKSFVADLSQRENTRRAKTEPVLPAYTRLTDEKPSKQSKPNKQMSDSELGSLWLK